MQQLHLTREESPAASAARAGLFPEASWYDTLLTAAEGDVFVWKPDGTPLLCVVRHALSGAGYQQAYAAIAPLALSPEGQGNRGIAAGRIPPLVSGAQLSAGHAKIFGRRSAVRYRPIKRDGTVSKTSYALNVPSSIMGFMERVPRFPYCRQTAYTNRHPARLRALLPCLQTCTQLFATHLPTRYAAQAAVVARTSPDFVIPGTVFTTLTVNRNWQTALHRDAGDLPEGFGVMACFRLGTYTGGYYVMPQFRIAVDLQAGDVLLSDVHEWHGNTPLEGDPRRYERLTLVCYYRAKMVDCGTQAEELARVKVARGSLL